MMLASPWLRSVGVAKVCGSAMDSVVAASFEGFTGAPSPPSLPWWLTHAQASSQEYKARRNFLLGGIQGCLFYFLIFLWAVQPIFQGKLEEDICRWGNRAALMWRWTPFPLLLPFLRQNLKTNNLVWAAHLKSLFICCPLKGSSKMTEFQFLFLKRHYPKIKKMPR